MAMTHRVSSVSGTWADRWPPTWSKAGYPVVGFDLVPAALERARAQRRQHRGLGRCRRGRCRRRHHHAAGRPACPFRSTAEPAARTTAACWPPLRAKPGTLFLDCSTIAVDDARIAHELLGAAGHRGLDAPVSGGVVGAEAGTLTFMVGGSEEDFADGAPLLQAMGGRIVHCGGPGAGQAAKVCNNMILGVSMIAVSEAFVLGEKLGLTNQALFDVAANASGQCWALTTNCPVPGPVPASPANRDYQPGFAGALMAKDLGLAVDALESTGVEAPLGSLAEEIYRRFADGPGAGQDFSAIINQIRAAARPAAAADQAANQDRVPKQDQIPQQDQIRQQDQIPKQDGAPA